MTFAFHLRLALPSTWEGLSMYLEDLFVLKDARGKGVGMAMCKAVTQAAREHDCARLQWQGTRRAERRAERSAPRRALAALKPLREPPC